MSKYESRSAEIKTEAAKLGLVPSWSLRDEKLYLKLTFKNDAPVISTSPVYALVRQFYRSVSMTSYGYGISATFRIEA